MNNVFYINNSIIINKLRSVGYNFRYGELYSSVVSSRQAQNEVTISYRFSFGQTDNSAEEPKPLEYFDLLVLDIVYYLWINRVNQPTFSINDIIYAATGKVAYLQKNRIEKFRRSLEKLSRITLEINCSEELEMRGKKDDFEPELSGRLAPIKITSKSIQREYEKDGSVETQEYDKIIYEITEEPVLYQYTDINNQIIAVPLDMMLSRGAKVKNTDRALLIKYYLIRELELIRKSGSRKQYKTQSFNDRCVRFISKMNNNSCIMQQIDSGEARGEAEQLIFRRDIIAELTKSAFINETKSVKNIVQKYLDFFAETGYLSRYTNTPTGITRNVVIRHICNDFSKRFASGSAEAALIAHLADSIKGDDEFSDEDEKTAEKILLCSSNDGQKPPYTFIYRSADGRGAVIGAEVEALNDPYSISWNAKSDSGGEKLPDNSADEVSTEAVTPSANVMGIDLDVLNDCFNNLDEDDDMPF